MNRYIGLFLALVMMISSVEGYLLLKEINHTPPQPELTHEYRKPIWRVAGCDDYQKDRSQCGLVRNEGFAMAYTVEYDEYAERQLTQDLPVWDYTAWLTWKLSQEE